MQNRNLGSFTLSGADGSIDIATNGCPYVVIDIHVDSFDAGTTPKSTFVVSRRGVDGVNYPIWNSNALAADETASRSFGPGMDVNTILGESLNLSWTSSGDPDDMDGTASVQGIVDE